MKRLALCLNGWPPQDRALWQTLTAFGDILNGRGPLSHLRNVSQAAAAASYGRWLAWLSASHPGQLPFDPVGRASADLFVEWMGQLGHLKPASKHSMFSGVLRILTAADPDNDWSRHRRFESLLRREIRDTPSTRKDGRIVSSAVLFEAARLHDAEHGAGRRPVSLKEAKQRRDAATVAFLAVMPIRRLAFCSLELGRSLFVTPTSIVVCLDASGLKSGSYWEAPLPPSLETIIRGYLQEVRPWLMAQYGEDHGFLWVNDHGRRFVDQHLGVRMPRITRGLVGTRVSMHLFRDCAATTLAYASPESARLTKGLLGHSSFKTAERHYNHARAVEAGRAYGRLIDAFKEDGEP